MSEIKGKEYALNEIFCEDFDFHIPTYQRPYAWTEDETKQLFDDLYEFFNERKDDKYFLGSIVLVKEEKNPKADVIDGQQRLTTLTIFIAILCDLIANNKDIEGFDRIENELKKFLYEDGQILKGIEGRPRLHLRNKDQDFFERYIQKVKIDEMQSLNTSKLNEAQAHIVKNCALLKKLIQEKIKGEDIKSFAQFLSNACYMIVVSTSDQNSAFRIFSVMNNRGLDLLPTDIIKAELIGKLDEDEQSNYTEIWENIEEQTSRAGLHEIFGHIRTIHMKAKAKKTLLEEFKENILPNYAPKDFIDRELKNYATAYNIIKNSNYKSESNAEEINKHLSWLNKIDNSDWMPPAIVFFAKFENNSNLIKEFIEKLDRLTSYLYITAKDVNKRIERYSLVVEEIEKLPSCNEANLKTIELSDIEKEEFIRSLDGKVYYMPSKRRNYILLRLDSFLSDGGAKYTSSILTIEHVLPQNPDENSSWCNDWTPDEREEWTNRIANLVLLTRKKNSEAQNYEFNEKKQKYFTSPKGTSSYCITTQVLNTEQWTPKAIKERQENLMNKFKEEWGLEQ